MQTAPLSDEDALVALHTRKFQKELNSGIVALALLAILNKASTPLYGYQISKQLQPQDEEKQGAIYPVLRNLHARELVSCEIKLSENGPPRKYYTVTALGQKVLAQWLISWQDTQSQINTLIHGHTAHEQ